MSTKYDFFIDHEGHEWEVTENVEAGGINATCESRRIQMWIDTETGAHEVADLDSANFMSNCMSEIADNALSLWRVKYPRY